MAVSGELQNRQFLIHQRDFRRPPQNAKVGGSLFASVAPMALDLEDARRLYHFAFNAEDRARLPFYAALLTALEHDEQAQVLLAEVRVEQRNPMLILASLHLAALKGHPVLTPIYSRARTGQMENPSRAATEVLGVVNDEPDTVHRELHRSTQTNEPGRSAVFRAVIALIAQRGHRVINIVDVGTSAGINLYFDRFPVRSRDDENPLTLVCRDDSPIDRSLPLPDVVSRIGVDLAPLDLSIEDDRLWLQACYWPEEPRRMARLDAVLAARPSWPTTTILTGSARDRLGDALALCDPSALTIVVNSYALGYFSESDQIAFFDEMTQRCASANVAWISLESPFMVQWATSLTTSDEARKGGTQILVTLPGGSPTQWGWCQHHGLWMTLDDDAIASSNA